MEALAALCEQPESLTRDHALAAALLKLEAVDFPAGADEMLALLKRLQKPMETRARELAEAWMDRWLELDTPGALRFLSDSSFLAELPTFELAGWALEYHVQSGSAGIFTALARRQPEWTRQTVADMKTGARREIAVYALLKELAQGGVTNAAQFLASFTEGQDRRGAVTGYVAGLVTTDVNAGFEKAWAEPPGPLRNELLTLVFNRAGERGTSEMSELLDRIDDPAVRRKFAATALESMGFEGNENALPFITAESERRAASGEWKSDTGDWASSVEVASRGPHVRTFAEWAVAFAPDASREMFGRIAGTWAGRAPSDFQDWLSKHAGTLDAAAAEKLGRPLATLARRDLAGARAWSEMLPPGALRDQARFQVALSAGAEGDLAQAESAYESVAASDSKGTLAGQLAAVLAKRDGTAAAQWAMRQPLGEARTAALRAVAETWSMLDPKGAAQWLERIPLGSERDIAVQTYAERAVLADPEAAAQWVEQVADPAARTQSANVVFVQWSRRNPVAARAWLCSLSGVEESMVLRNTR